MILICWFLNVENSDSVGPVNREVVTYRLTGSIFASVRIMLKVPQNPIKMLCFAPALASWLNSVFCRDCHLAFHQERDRMEKTDGRGSAKKLISLRPLRVWLSVLWIALFFFEAAWAQKTDIVALKNGDRLTGEVKELKFGKLEYSTDDVGTIFIEWDKVIFLKSKSTYEFETEAGDKYFGTVDTDTTKNKLLVLNQNRTVSLELSRVIRISRIKDSFWKRLDGSADLGFSYTKASEVGQLILNADVRYRTRRISSNLSASSTHTFREDEETTKRNALKWISFLFFPDPWATAGLVKLEQNSELGIDLRLLLGGGLARFLIETNFSQLAVLVGLQLNQEWVADGEPVDFNLESLVSAQFQTYRFDEPELEFSTTLNVLPELTPVGRVRAEFEVGLKWEIVRDFFWNLNLYDQFDSEPPTDAAAKNDWGVVLSFGVTF